jgi:transcriptional regulator with GAF, ATPase, and Fis domain
MEPTGDPVDLFAHVARALAEQDTLEGTLQAIVDLAVRTVPGAEHAAISMISGRREVATVAATHDVCRRVDQVQYETGEGPCLDAIWQQEAVGIADLGATDRWPHFASRAAVLGIGSMLALRLFVEDETAGAVNLYATAPHAFPDEAVHLGQVFAAHAALAHDHAREAAGLHSAIASREVIGQAQGILMAQHQVTPDEAFGMLRRTSQRRNVKLRELARAVVETGQLPV